MGTLDYITFSMAETTTSKAAAYVETGRTGSVIEDALTHSRRVLVAGGAGFIGSHLAKRLKEEGHFVRVADVQCNEYFEETEYCSEYIQADLRDGEACKRVCEGMDWVFMLAADMGGMGYIKSNNAVILYNSAMITLSMIEAARQAGVKRYFYSSSACVYNEANQLDPECADLTEDMAWPARPQDGYGLEKLYGEEIAIAYAEDFPGFETRIARFHNIYGPQGTWKGGREKAPAAFCRKAIVSTDSFEMWGDGLQSRSFTFIDDCVEGVLRLFYSDFAKPINIGSDEMISMLDFARLALSLAGKDDLPFHHIEGPEGVRGRNSENSVIKAVLGWAPSVSLKDGLSATFDWIKTQVDSDIANGVDVQAEYGMSKIAAREIVEGQAFDAM